MYCLVISMVICQIDLGFTLRDAPVLTIGSSAETRLVSPCDVELGPNKEFYVVDQGRDSVFIYNQSGKSTGHIGETGKAPGSFKAPTDACFINDRLWVADSENMRIQIFKGKKIDATIPLDFMPVNLVSVKDKVFVSSRSVLSESGGIHIMDQDGRLVSNIDLSISVSPTTNALWNDAKLSASENSLLVGFRFHNSLAFLNVDTMDGSNTSMESFYPRYEEMNESTLYPVGYTAYSFAFGPRGEIFVAVCNQEKRECRQLMQFSSDGQRLLSTRDMPFHIKAMSFIPKENLLAMVSPEEEILFYKLETTKQ